MKFIIIPTEEKDRYRRIINRHNEICPVEINSLWGLPLSVLEISKIDKLFIKLVTLGEVDTVLKDLPIQDITITIKE